MLAASITAKGFPLLHLEDKVSFALKCMEDFDVQELAVVKEDYFLGIVQKSDLFGLYRAGSEDRERVGPGVKVKVQFGFLKPPRECGDVCAGVGARRKAVCGSQPCKRAPRGTGGWAGRC